MAFAIEAQGETNPLSAQNVLNTLILASSSSQQQVRVGTEQLQNWEKQGMYYSFLQVLVDKFWLLTFQFNDTLLHYTGNLPRPFCTKRSSLSRNHPIEERH